MRAKPCPCIGMPLSWPGPGDQARSAWRSGPGTRRPPGRSSSTCPASASCRAPGTPCPARPVIATGYAWPPPVIHEPSSAWLRGEVVQPLDHGPQRLGRDVLGQDFLLLARPRGRAGSRARRPTGGEPDGRSGRRKARRGRARSAADRSRVGSFAAPPLASAFGDLATSNRTRSSTRTGISWNFDDSSRLRGTSSSFGPSRSRRHRSRTSRPARRPRGPPATGPSSTPLSWPAARPAPGRRRSPARRPSPGASSKSSRTNRTSPLALVRTGSSNRVIRSPAADLPAGVLGDVQQLGDELEQGLLVHLRMFEHVDDELPRELDLDLALARGGHVHVVRVVHLPLLVDEQAPLLDRDVAQLQRGEGVLEPLLGVAVLDDRVGGQLRGGRDLQVDLQPVRLGGGRRPCPTTVNPSMFAWRRRRPSENWARAGHAATASGHRRGDDDRDVRPSHSTPLVLGAAVPSRAIVSAPADRRG